MIVYIYIVYRGNGVYVFVYVYLFIYIIYIWCSTLTPLASKNGPILSNKRSKILVHPIYTLQKPNMTMENPPIEDVFPIAIVGFFQRQLQFSGVYVLSFQLSGFFQFSDIFSPKSSGTGQSPTWRFWELWNWQLRTLPVEDSRWDRHPIPTNPTLWDGASLTGIPAKSSFLNQRTGA